MEDASYIKHNDDSLNSVHSMREHVGYYVVKQPRFQHLLHAVFVAYCEPTVICCYVRFPCTVITPHACKVIGSVSLFVSTKIAKSRHSVIAVNSNCKVAKTKSGLCVPHREQSGSVPSAFPAVSYF